MAETFVLEITTPERLIAREPVTEAQIPGLDGYLGVLPGHAALLGELGFGELSYKTGGTCIGLLSTAVLLRSMAILRGCCAVQRRCRIKLIWNVRRRLWSEHARG